MVQILLEFNANIFAKDGNGLTPMDLAVNGHHTAVVDLLKQAVIGVERKRKEYYESIALAVHKGDGQTVQALLAEANLVPFCEDDDGGSGSGETKAFVNYSPNGSNTLLFKACQEGHLEIVQLLLKAGADSRQHPVTKYSPLYISAYHGRYQICLLLLQHFPELSSVYTVEHWLPIHAAAMNNHQNIVQLFLEYSYPKATMKRFKAYCDNAEPLVYSALAPSSATKSFDNNQAQGHNLKDYDKQYVYFMPFDVNAQDIAGQSILYLATLLGNKFLVEYLLNYKFKAISYADYVLLFGDEDKVKGRVSGGGRHQHKRSLSSENEFEIIFSDVDRLDGSSEEDDGDVSPVSSGSSSSSSQDLTVIGPAQRHHHVATNPVSIVSADKPKAAEEKSSFSSSIQKLIEKLSPTHQASNDKQQATFQTSQPSALGSPTPSDQSGRSKRKSVRINLSHQCQIYEVNAFTIDLYCNYNMETALHCAVKKRHYSIASFLLERGADASLPIYINCPSTLNMVTRVSHFNQNFFPQSLSDSLRDLRKLSTSDSTERLNQLDADSSGKILGSASAKMDENSSSTQPTQVYQSNAVREAVRNRDKAMLDLLLRNGARDDPLLNSGEDGDEDGDGKGKQPSLTMSALAIAFANGDYSFVSKLLSLNAFADSEYKVNKKAFDIVGSNCMSAMNKFNMSEYFEVGFVSSLPKLQLVLQSTT